ncbi:hypothetical protein O3M35_001090 [Rhynocoris fuscipes]|uniref:CHK kinase-like domain-containing protein n=1 Tax=Rhynocoris fuscipes TaxID=488301 RepID=A0AAW1DQ23_9HEMI
MEENAWLETILNKNINDNSIAKLLNVTTDSAVPEGVNYTSIIKRATLEVLLHSGRKSKISVILKQNHNDEEKAKMIAEFSMFKKEINIYTNVLSKFDQLMDDCQDNGDKLWCNLIGYKPYSFMVLEDLKARNFTLAERTKFQDKNHALLVLNSLGRFHALGYVLIKRGLLSKEDFSVFYMEAQDSTITNKFLKGGLRKLCSVIENDWSSEWKEIGKKLKKQEDVLEERIAALFTSKENSFQTVCHGDCWTCNIMFKYCPYEKEIPIALKFLDLQLSHLNSHGFDILYYMYTSVRVHDRTAYWNELIAEYHRSLKSTLTDYGMEADAPTLDQIHAELKRLEYYGFIVSLSIMPITIAEGDGKYEMEKLNDENGPENAFTTGIYNGENVKAAIQPVLRKFFDEGLF